MNKRLGNARLEWYDVELLFWGSIVPPETEDIAKKPWLWDVWGTGPRGQKQQPYLDIGASGFYVRKFWVTQLFVQENYTSGITSGLHGGFCSQVSGLYPASGFNLATKDYVDYQISIIPIPSGGSGSTSLSGLTDVSGIWSSGTVVSWNGLYFVPATFATTGGSSSLSGLNDVSGVWTSGTVVSWNGTYFIPATTGVASSGNWEISGTSAALNATLPGRFAASGALFGNGTSGTLPVYDGTKHLTNSILSQVAGQLKISGATGTALFDMSLVIGDQTYVLPQPVSHGAFVLGATAGGNYLPAWTSQFELGDSTIYFDGNLFAIATADAGGFNFRVGANGSNYYNVYAPNGGGEIVHSAPGSGGRHKFTGNTTASTPVVLVDGGLKANLWIEALTTSSGTSGLFGILSVRGQDSDARYLLSGLYQVSGTSYTKAESDARYTLSGTGGGSAAISTLTDVILTTPTSGQVLGYDGTNWRNAPDATGAGSSLAADDVTLQIAVQFFN